MGSKQMNEEIKEFNKKINKDKKEGFQKNMDVNINDDDTISYVEFVISRTISKNENLILIFTIIYLNFETWKEIFSIRVNYQIK